MLETEKAILAA